jgi:hypothetical protein
VLRIKGVGESCTVKAGLDIYPKMRV